MFFQFSPVRLEAKKKVVRKENESEKVEVLSLAPFTPNPKLFFEDIKVGATVDRKLLVTNPTNRNINLFIRSNIPEELNVTLSWDEITIEKGTERILEVTWHPLKEELARYTLTIEDGERVRRDVPIALKSLSSNKSKTGAKPKSKVQKSSIKKTSPSKRYYTNKPPNISPKKFSARTRNMSPRKTSPLQSSLIAQKLSPRVRKGNVPPYADSQKTGKESIPWMDISTHSNVFVSPGSATFHIEHPQQKERRETYVVNGNKETNKEKSPSESIFHDSLEAITSPEESPQLKRSPQINRLFPKKSPLGISNWDNVSPITPQYYHQNLLKPPTTYDFAYKLTQLESFCFTPRGHKENLDPLSPTIENLMKSNESIGPETTNTVQTNRTFEVPISISRNISPETYVKSNLSTETYVKGNASFETYVKGNISGGTYTKDNSVGDVNNLSFSPVSSRSLTSPSIPKPQINIYPSTNNAYSDNVQNITETNVWSGIRAQPLYSIREESYIHQENEAESPQKSFLKRKSNFIQTSRPSKRLNVTSTPNDWSKKGGTAFRIAKKTSGLNLKQFINNENQFNNKEVAVITKQDTSRIIIQNPFLLAATNFADPFMTANLYVNEEWLNQQQIDFKKWLNALLTPPEGLTSKEQVIDVAKVWQECKRQELEIAPSKEVVSSNYHTNHKLNSLRKSAQHLFTSKEMSTVLSKVTLAVEAGRLTIRDDKDVHLNLALKSQIMSLLLSYNPLWLRIGLETIYNETIPLRSNSDVMGLSTFIANRLLKDPYLIRKHKVVYNRKYVADFNKFFLKKFFVLVYFLDQAKNKKLIAHDPCLFCKNAPVKESKEMLVGLARDLLAAIGDVTKFLKYLGYIVSHKQTYIHEFDYAVNNLGVDLRDGVRLTKVMEIILMQEDLTSNLRVPAISRLQKVHNMKIVFDSLEKAGYKILYDILPRDIVDGHKEKTLSFLWQIIYKFQAPLMVKSATTIQKWFRSLPVILKRRQLEKLRLKQENAATKIQAWYRHQKVAKNLLAFATLLERYLKLIRTERAATKIQSYYRMYRCRKVYSMIRNAVLNIQRFSKGWLVRNIDRERIKKTVVIQRHIRGYLARKNFEQLKHAAGVVQARYRAKRRMDKDRKSYVQLKSAAIFIQRRFRANVLAFIERNRYQEVKSAAMYMQQRYRANKLCRIEHRRYLEVRTATIHIQSWYRSLISMRKCRGRFVMVRKSAIVIEQWYVAVTTRRRFLQLKHAVSVTQSRYRAKRQMEKDRRSYNEFKYAANIIQQRYRAKKEMEKAHKLFTQLKITTVFIQRKFRANILAVKAKDSYQELRSATICIQQRYRANKLCKNERGKYLEVRAATVCIQAWYRSIMSMRVCRKRFIMLKKSAIVIEQRYITVTTRRRFLQLKNAVSVIQSRYSAKKQMEKDRQSYNELKCAANIIQRRYHARKEMEKARKLFTQLKITTVFIQRKFRANILAEKAKVSYQELRSATICIQQRYRANKLCKNERGKYLEVHAATVHIQAWYRSIMFMRVCRERFVMLKKSAIVIEQRYITVTTRRRFLQLKNAVTVIQSRYSAKKQMEKDRQSYNELKCAANIIQRRYRAKKEMEKARKLFTQLKMTTVFIQRQFRANLLTVKAKDSYQELRSAAICIQQWYRAKKLCKIGRQKYLEVRAATVSIQAWYRSTMSMRVCHRQFVLLKKSVITIEDWYLTKTTRKRFLQMKCATSVIQARYRAKKQMENDYAAYNQLKYGACVVQARYRAKKQMEIACASYKQLKTVVLHVQRRFRANTLAAREKEHYQKLKKAAICIQQHYRANNLCQNDRKRFLELRTAAICIQTRYRSLVSMRACRERFIILKKSVMLIENWYKTLKTRDRFLQLKSAANIIQTRYRAKKQMENECHSYNQLHTTTLFVQRKWRANVLAQRQRNYYQNKKSAAITIQQRYRANKLCRIERHRYLQVYLATINIQIWYRSVISMRTYRQRFLTLKKSVIIIEQHYTALKTMQSERTSYMALRSACICIQQNYHALREMRTRRKEYLELRAAAIVIQRRYRAQLAMRRARSEYIILKSAAIFVQRHFIASMSMRKAREYYTSLLRHTISVQRCFRANRAMRVEKTYYTNLKNAAVYIQRRWRANRLCRHNRSNYIGLRMATVVIQQRWRAQKVMKLASRQYFIIKQSTVVIQRWFRATALMLQSRQRYLKMQTANITIQRYYRGYKQMKVERKDFEVKRNAALSLQKYIRGYLVRQKYKDYFTPEARAQRQKEREERKAAIKIQAIWRGHKSRISLPELTAIRQRARTANLTAEPNNTLQSRCNIALQALVNEKSTIFIVSKTLGDLEYVTRHSSEICTQVANFLPEQMYLMIKTTNRSLPEMTVCIYSVNILINVFKYHQTRPCTFFPQYIDNIITVMLHWCDKEALLFPAMCTLLWLLAHIPLWKESIRSLPNTKQMFHKIQTQVSRKEGMVRRASNKGQSLFAPYKNLPVPSCDPDWGLVRKDKPYAFTNSSHAFSSLLSILHL